jgi:peptidoglycan/xylan/chitin deacetylase (PgdA/CDA1 family)
MTDLWRLDTVQNFWMTSPSIPDDNWNEAIRKSRGILDLDENIVLRDIPFLTLGEGRFGLDHWKLSFVKRVYYLLKPAIPRLFTRVLRRIYSKPGNLKTISHWPIDDRYPMFLWEVLRQLLSQTHQDSIQVRRFWPGDHRYSLVLTHDIETSLGQSFVRQVADLEESLGFRSSFNFVLERYPLDIKLMQELRERGFEVGCHGLKHDGKLFNSKDGFNRKAKKINKYLKEFGMTGFRAPLTHRNPEWMQTLDIQYDLSFFDTDPFEPIPGGAMTIWPFFIGHFVELPYTLVQDYTLTSVLAENSPQIWLDKVDFIEKYHGMVLLNSHPDYLSDQKNWDVYNRFLMEMKQRQGYWHALPRDAAKWWVDRRGGNNTNTADLKLFSIARSKDGVLDLDNIGEDHLPVYS